MLILKLASAFDILDIVLLEQIFDTFCQTGNGGVLGLHHLLEVEFDVADIDAAVLGVVLDHVVDVRVVEEGFGGDAADVEAGSAEGATLLDTGDLDTQTNVSRLALGRAQWWPVVTTFMPSWPALMAAT